MIEILPIATPSLGDRSYVVTDGEVAVVVDPQRDHDRVLAVTRPRGLRITHVLETHIHNDYVTGGLALAREVGAQYCVNADDPVTFERHPVRDGDLLETGRIRVRVLHTPGHTFTHLSYAVSELTHGIGDTGGTDGTDGTEQVVGVLTGGSLLFGSTGRPDLLGTDHADTLARHQHASAQRLVRELPPAAGVFPTHGFGSFCAATQAGGLSSTLADEARTNPALTLAEDDYVTQLLAGLTAYPAYYAHMAPANSAGPVAPDLSPPQTADPEEVRRRIAAGEWVVDLRNRTAYAAGHVPGAVNVGLDDSFVTYLGWLLPWGTPVTLLGETAQDVAAAQRELVRIGIDRPAAAATGKAEDWAGDRPLTGFDTRTFAHLAAEKAGTGVLPFVLDVRRDDEHAAGAVAGSVNVPLHTLLGRLDEVPDDRPVWVHCARGYRASVAASLLDRAGRDVVLVDDAFEAAKEAGL